jgi:phosphatidylethanolamine/phosphatidyl-N-methylethanolamine N-methyltransferase
VTTTSNDLRAFFAAVTRNPMGVGAVAPSAASLCRRLAEIVPSVDPSVVLELGPGTGAVSNAIGRRLVDGSRHVAIELDPQLATHLQASYPKTEVVNGNAADLAEILNGKGISQVDAVVSGLPWSLIPSDQQRRIILTAASMLAPGAAFTTFAYLHALPMSRARELRKLLREAFDEVIITRSVWWNAPPALTYVCRRPRLAVTSG